MKKKSVLKTTNVKQLLKDTEKWLNSKEGIKTMKKLADESDERARKKRESDREFWHKWHTELKHIPLGQGTSLLY